MGGRMRRALAVIAVGSVAFPSPGAFAPGEARAPAVPSYAVTLASDAGGGTWTGHETVRFTNPSDTPLGEVYLRLWDNYRGRCPATPVTVTNVTGGTAGTPQAACTALRIALPAPLARGQSGSVGFDLKIVVPRGTDRFGRDGAYSFIGNALPVLAVRDGAGWHLDPYSRSGESFYSLAADFRVTLDHPSSIRVPATGTSTDAPGSTGRTVTTASASQVRDFAWAAGPFTEISGTSPGGVRVHVYGTPGVSPHSAQSMLNIATASLDSHGRRFGAYPYGEADVVLDDHFWFAGMEYPGLVLDILGGKALAHEMAHQWWYGIVGDDEYGAPWLDESFADYATDLYQGDTGAGCWKNVRWSSPDERITASMAYWDGHPNRYSTVVYDYGRCALHDLRRVLGEAAMAALLRDYAHAHWYGVSTTAEFKAAAQARTAADLTGFWREHRI
jgi:Peptidase family M1 domain